MIGSLVTAAWFWGVIGLTEQTAILGLIIGLLASLIVAAGTSGTLNVMIERVAYRPLRTAPETGAAHHRRWHVILQNVGILWIGGSAGGRAGTRRPAEGALH